ncbi:hypothetical protein C8R47DRAFT_402167 [Mycena vitilis]|nr:hypothetical protein C8R47DRAFT_402167 [Mycena vitilis]
MCLCARLPRGWSSPTRLSFILIIVVCIALLADTGQRCIRFSVEFSVGSSPDGGIKYVVSFVGSYAQYQLRIPRPICTACISLIASVGMFMSTSLRLTLVNFAVERQKNSEFFEQNQFSSHTMGYCEPESCRRKCIPVAGSRGFKLKDQAEGQSN